MLANLLRAAAQASVLLPDGAALGFGASKVDDSTRAIWLLEPTIQQGNLWAADRRPAKTRIPPTLEDALGYLDLPAELKPAKLERAAVPWHGRLEPEAMFLSLAESQLALTSPRATLPGSGTRLRVAAAARRVRPRESHRG